jgi:hypothetical protein
MSDDCTNLTTILHLTYSYLTNIFFLSLLTQSYTYLTFILHNLTLILHLSYTILHLSYTKLSLILQLSYSYPTLITHLPYINLKLILLSYMYLAQSYSYLTRILHNLTVILRSSYTCLTPCILKYLSFSILFMSLARELKHSENSNHSFL